MKQYINITDFHIDKATVLTIGKFDGEHIGHRKLLAVMKGIAEEKGLKTAVFTFNTAPSEIIGGAESKEAGLNPSQITTNDERNKMLNDSGIDYLIEYPFNKEVARIKAEDFIKDILIKKMNMKAVVAGPDCAFGHNKEGNAELLTKVAAELPKELSYEVIIIDKEKDEYDRDISSTLIREELDKGNIENANKLLGTCYSIHGKVLHGNMIGGKLLGFPTANIIPQKNVLDLAVDKVSIFSYLNGMFSNRLSNVLGDGENSVSLMGDKLSDRTLYRCELEYILYGNDNLNQNLSEAVNRIRVLRFISNLIYAFTSNELQTEVSAVAFAVAGWTGFGVPFVQSALLAVLAICETGLDTSDLLAGKSVPILKSPTTWKCSLSGIKPVVEGVITDIFDQLRIETESGIEAFEQSIDTQLNELKNSCMNMVEGNVSVPLQKIIEDALTRENEPTADEIQAQYIEVLSGIGDEIGDGGIGDAMKEAVQNLSGNGSFGETVYALISKKKDSGGKTKDILAEGNTYVEKLVNPAMREASSVLDSVCDKWKKKSNQILDKGEKLAQKEAARWISGLQKDLGTKDLSAKMSTGSILTMNYQDYLALFLIIHLITDSGKNQLLNNAAKLIHVESEGVDISRASSGFRQEIKEDVFVFFLDNLNYFIPFTGNSGENRYEIRQVWVEGYGIYD